MLILYEYLLTLSDETELFWDGKITGATFLFLANRYLALVNYLYELVTNAISYPATSGRVSFAFLCYCCVLTLSSQM